MSGKINSRVPLSLQEFYEKILMEKLKNIQKDQYRPLNPLIQSHPSGKCCRAIAQEWRDLDSLHCLFISDELDVPRKLAE